MQYDINTTTHTHTDTEDMVEAHKYEVVLDAVQTYLTPFVLTHRTPPLPTSNTNLQTGGRSVTTRWSSVSYCCCCSCIGCSCAVSSKQAALELTSG